MADDQSVVGRRRIYYDQNGSEALICSDSEEEITEPDEEKHEFSETENRIIRLVQTTHYFQMIKCIEEKQSIWVNNVDDLRFPI